MRGAITNRKNRASAVPQARVATDALVRQAGHSSAPWRALVRALALIYPIRLRIFASHPTYPNHWEFPVSELRRMTMRRLMFVLLIFATGLGLCEEPIRVNVKLV